VKVFARRGYFAARVADVARRAGVADGTIYLYFRNKEDILVSLFDEVMSEHLEGKRREMEPGEPAPVRLRAIAERHLALLGRNRDLAVVFQVELRQSTKFMERFTASWLQDYFTLIAEVIEQPPRQSPIAGDGAEDGAGNDAEDEASGDTRQRRGDVAAQFAAPRQLGDGGKHF